ncbi:AAA family ATPase [Bifidobacterium crudilactis]|uniref:AAA family ATPase n=1 Tax=Bifidobacterium crudilactis TaxID=327277 RepID=UPI00264805B8|nr:AAA family ATPase [Bifidobacterium crudilactis]MDN5973068.1 AAA family ATPase [Bifidobacterium crudilactis]MDN6000291.1 AAA family ATPase [Bifidobacterium crudilactis]MDN6209000.1 AAA family ATPase [Bifidobacterium crudilactis]MDN6467900.1 AAA family ATPase [Bifidobacterium crudilactis]MDN6558660.1 AAA family ATPase [Bifidobacterium crudilactis]
MTADPVITIVDGPSAFFEEQLKLQQGNCIGLLRIARLVDETTRTFRIQPPDGSDLRELDRASFIDKQICARSNDYASISEHVRLNFTEFIDQIEPQLVLLHNPPKHIREQVISSFNQVNTITYDYPEISEENLTELSESFPDKVLGQERSLDGLLAAFQTMIDMNDNKPLVLLFLGPSGVGKTETAKLISTILGGTLLRKQFSMFQNNSFASYLFGGELSEDSFGHDLLDRTSNVILLDEFDKANAVFHSAFYQLFDEGEFVERNYRVNVKRAIIICTSNYTSSDEARSKLGDPIYSRFDAIVPFGPLPVQAIHRMIETMVQERFDKLTAEQSRRLDKTEIVNTLQSQSSQFHNARYLRSFINDYISLLRIQLRSISITKTTEKS